MSIQIGEILGLTAGIFSTFALVPQVIRIYRTRSADDISLLFSAMFVIGGLLWLSYGILDRLLPIIIWNVLGVTFSSLLLIGKLKYMKKESKDSN
ncbi:MAG TPA: SemiSWEET family transporter [Dehalococcoidales bacterium]|nr:SemiSWEET family transporter [Dehalococcoidales bacterium]